MDHFAGLDVSVKDTSVCIVDETGKIIREVKVASEPDALLTVLTSPRYHFKRIGLEAGPLSQWLFSAEQTANGDSSRAGQWDNSLGFLGVSSATYGTLTGGRLISLSNEVAVGYDPTLSNAFSLIGNSGPFPRYGFPELVRVNTGLQYRLEYGNYRVAGLAQIGNGYALGNGSMGEYEAQIGATFGGFSADAVVRYAKDAVSLQTFSGSDLPAGSNPASVLQATLANIATWHCLSTTI